MLEFAFINDYQPGATLFSEGMNGDVMYTIINGQVEIYRKDENRKEVPVALLNSGEFLGEMSFIESAQRTANARITTPTKLVVITRRAFERLMEVHPAITTKLLFRKNHLHNNPCSLKLSEPAFVIIT